MKRVTATFAMACVVAAVLALAASHALAAGNGPKVPPAVMAKLKQYPTRYYTVYSDLPTDDAQAAIAHITAVAEFFNELTKPYGGGKITTKYDVFVILDNKIYPAVGGEAYGCAWADRLCAHITKEFAFETWHVIQHEMLHQFVHAIASWDVAPWMDEGLSEYYGEGLWTGDGVSAGVFPAHRFKRCIPSYSQGKFKPFKDIIAFKPWPSGVDNYDQALAMVHFFMNAQNGKYQKAVISYIKMTAAKAPPDVAFARCFGGNIGAVEKEFVQYVKNDLPKISERSYAKATVATLTSYLGRAWSQRQNFATFDEFLAAAKDGSLKKHPKQPLPDDLLKDNLARAEKLKTWSLDVPEKGQPKLVLTLDDGTLMTGTFRLKNTRVDEVKVDVKEGKPASEK